MNELSADLIDNREQAVPQKWNAKLDTSIFITDQNQVISHRKILRVSTHKIFFKCYQIESI